MGEYIEREYLLDLYKGFDTPEYERLSVPCPVVYQNVLDVPAADVVEVVRCRDCLLRRGCKPAQYLGDDGFCSHGERKGGVNDDHNEMGQNCTIAETM